MLIDGATRARPANGATFERRNPLDGKVATRAPAATVRADALSAVDAAAARLRHLGRHRARASAARC
ncbi:hypothetical protein ACU4GD_22380 [Cupriavidus basilensis]